MAMFLPGSFNFRIYLCTFRQAEYVVNEIYVAHFVNLHTIQNAKCKRT